MRKIIGLFIFLFAGVANSAMIDTTASWTGSVNDGWFGSGQSLTVDDTDTFFDNITFSFDGSTNGRTFDFILSDALNGGNTLFSTTFNVNSGLGFININTNLVSGSTVYALIDYNGYSGRSAYYQSNVYAGGNSNFGDNGFRTDYAGFDHVFVANFSQVNQVPEPTSIALLGLGFAGLVFSRRKKAS